MDVVLFQPEIPQNTGTIVRLCACLDVPLGIVLPAAFNTSDKGFRRAGMDYIGEAEIHRHRSFTTFERDRQAAGKRLVLLTTKGAASLYDFAFRADDVLLFGRESAGAPPYVHDAADARLKIPMRAGLRSLNIAVSVALTLGEALRQTGGFAALEATLQIDDAPAGGACDETTGR